MSNDAGKKAIKVVLILLLLVSPLLLASCARVGRDFSESKVSKIQTGKTTQKDIQRMFGPPWRTGIEDGNTTWTYGKYYYSVFGETSTKDLVIRFNDAGVVTSYLFNTTEPEEK